MNRKKSQEKRELKNAAEKLLVDYEIRNRAKDNLDKVSHNIQKMDDNIDQQIEVKKDLLNSLKARRSSIHEDSKIKKDFLDNELRNKLRSGQSYTAKELELITVNQINTIDIDRDDFDSVEYNKEFAKKENINIDSPFLNLYSKNEQVKVAEQMIQKFDLLNLDSDDYLFATSAGLIAGFVDTIFVGTIGKGKDAKGLQKMVDKGTEKLVKKYALHQKIAELNNQKKNAKSQKGINEIERTIKELQNGRQNFDIKSSIRYLEKKHKVGYDAATSKHIKGMSPDNHHLLSIAHEPSLLGLIIGIYNQLTGTATYMSKEGKIINTVAENANIELTGSMPNQIIQAINNWFGHIMSDLSGSSTSKGRGSGLPVPGWSSLQKLQFGNVKLKTNKPDTYTFAQVSEWMFKNGYDVRAFTAELIPVLIYETLIRLYWIYKQHLYYGKSLKDSFPIANSRELARLLLIGASTFSTIDVTHGVIKSGEKGGVQPIGIATFIMTVNKPGLIDLGFRSYQNIRFELEHKKHVDYIISKDIKIEYNRVMTTENIFE
ncbi:ATP-binding protein [Staphylococcus epidermidis]|uniref:ATP-binding protein n=1 Tax=Staphylococcus TaxID=1279 RepID=UPI0008A8CFF6|nr:MULTISPECIES: ATP-binding protein [Staphylococcus]MDT0742940.1 ATP-binding protein [Staphylococcus epidermidis]OHQ45459.1 ATP-binding protein [Staphylococcus sp. HMSC070A07]